MGATETMRRGHSSNSVPTPGIEGSRDRGIRRSSRGRLTCRGALLLEVVLAMAILVAALGVFGAQLVSGLRMTETADLRTRAEAMLERVLALSEYDPEMQDLLLSEERTDGDFGDEYPGWTWEIDFLPIEEVAGLGQVRISVLYRSPDDVGRDSRGPQLVGQAVMLKAARAKINLVDDFGLPTEKVDELAALMPEEFDPTDFDPQKLIELATTDPQMIMTLLPALVPLLQQYFGQSGLPAGLEIPGGLEGLMGGLQSGDATGGLTQEQLGQLEGLAGELTGGGGRGGAGGHQGGAVKPPGGGPPPGAGSVTPRGGQGRGGRGGAAGRGGQAGGGSGGGAQKPPGAGAGGQPQYTIEDLMRMRDELQKGGG
jgi:hypothetical protein